MLCRESDKESEMGEEVCVADLAQEEARQEEADVDVDDYMEFDPYAFIKSLPPLEQCAPTWRRALLPKQTRNCKRKTLVGLPLLRSWPDSPSLYWTASCACMVLCWTCLCYEQQMVAWVDQSSMSDLVEGLRRRRDWSSGGTISPVPRLGKWQFEYN